MTPSQDKEKAEAQRRKMQKERRAAEAYTLRTTMPTQYDLVQGILQDWVDQKQAEVLDLKDTDKKSEMRRRLTALRTAKESLSLLKNAEAEGLVKPVKL